LYLYFIHNKILITTNDFKVVSFYQSTLRTIYLKFSTFGMEVWRYTVEF